MNTNLEKFISRIKEIFDLYQYQAKLIGDALRTLSNSSLEDPFEPLILNELSSFENSKKRNQQKEYRRYMDSIYKVQSKNLKLSKTDDQKNLPYQRRQY